MSSYQHIRDFIAAQLRHRESVGQRHYRPSDVWADGALLLRYVRTLPDEELERLRFHTQYITGDTCIRYLYEPDLMPGMLAFYEKVAAEMAGFRPSEMSNSFGFETSDGKVVTFDLIRYMLPLHNLFEAGVLSRTQPVTFLEVGGGFGGLARLALEFNPNASYLLCDLEETMFFQGVYLTQSLGPQRVHLLDGAESAMAFEPGHAYLLPQHRSESLYRFAFDIAVNQQSMQEMTAKQVENYCDIISKTSTYFFSCNLDEHPPMLLLGSKAANEPLIKNLNAYLASRFEIVASNLPPGAPIVPREQWPGTFHVHDLILNRTVYKMPAG